MVIKRESDAFSRRQLGLRRELEVITLIEPDMWQTNSQGLSAMGFYGTENAV